MKLNSYIKQNLSDIKMTRLMLVRAADVPILEIKKLIDNNERISDFYMRKIAKILKISLGQLRALESSQMDKLNKLYFIYTRPPKTYKHTNWAKLDSTIAQRRRAGQSFNTIASELDVNCGSLKNYWSKAHRCTR